MKIEPEILTYRHMCEMCGRPWDSEEKADQCPECGHWHINFFGSSFIQDTSDNFINSAPPRGGMKGD